MTCKQTNVIQILRLLITVLLRRQQCLLWVEWVAIFADDMLWSKRMVWAIYIKANRVLWSHTKSAHTYYHLDSPIWTLSSSLQSLGSSSHHSHYPMTFAVSSPEISDTEFNNCWTQYRCHPETFSRKPNLTLQRFIYIITVLTVTSTST